MRRTGALAVLFTVSMLISGCSGDSDLAGAYYGTLSNDKTAQAVVAYVPTVQPAGDIHLEIPIYEIRGSAAPQVLKIILKNQILTMESAGKTWLFETRQENNCLMGLDATQVKVTFCLAPGDIKIVLDKDQAVIFQLDLKRTETMPAFQKTSSDSYSVDELLGRAKFFNYTVAHQAEEFYRAKQRVGVALGNLLPRLSLREPLNFVVEGPLGLLNSIGNFVPFLFPSNWFHFDQAKEALQAEKMAYASLRGNEVMAVEGLAYFHLRNLQIFNLFQQNANWMETLQNQIEKGEEAGEWPRKSSLVVAVKVDEQRLDVLQLQGFLQQEESALAQAVGLPPEWPLAVRDVSSPDLALAQDIRSDFCLNEVLEKSFELKSLDHLIEVSRLETEANSFSFLDPEIEGGLGFGTASVLRVGKSFMRDLLVKKEETLSLLKKRCGDAVVEANTSVRSFKLVEHQLKNYLDLRRQLLYRLFQGAESNTELLLELMNSSNEILKGRAAQLSAVYNYLMALGKIHRLRLDGPYRDLDAGL